MRRTGFAFLALLTAACAAPVDVLPSLDLYEAKVDPHAMNSHFRSEIAHRYEKTSDAATIKDDLAGQAFQCADAAGETVSTCTLVKPHGFCTNQWVVELRRPHHAKEANAVEARGKFVQTCTYPK